MSPDVHADGRSAQDFAVGRSRRAAERTAAMRHPLLWTSGKVRRKRGLSERHPVPTTPDEFFDRLVNLPVSLWTYGWDHPSVRHLGPMSQDFAKAFGLGSNDRVIDMVDANGVMTVTVQVLAKRLAALEAEVADLRSQLASDPAASEGT